jgi:NADP-reducing hydrogenase subunit HndD
MVNVTINGIALQVEEGTTILDAAKSAGMNIPTLCYMKQYSDIGACRICVVEVEGMHHLQAACNTVCQEGMVIHTNNPRVRESRRTTLELLLTQHNVECPSCERNGNCELQRLSSIYTVGDHRKYKKELPENDWDQTLPLIRDEDKCIKCYRCVQVCSKIQSMNIWDMVGSGMHTTVAVSDDRKFPNTDCTYCGQCITHCPTNALHARDDTDKVVGLMGAVKKKGKTVVVQVAPAVRVGWGEEFGLSPEVATEKRLAAALRRIGFDYVFDTNFSADLTIMEEGNEFLKRMKDKDKYKWPMFTSCCPGWVRFCKGQYPDMTDNLSTAKSPMQMFGAVTKSYFAKKIGVDPKDIICVSIMPCTAKKAELDIPSINDADPEEGVKDVDISLTTRELCRIFKMTQLDIASLPEENFDSPLGSGTGAAVIFGTTGGVMEAALRTCYYVMTGENPNADETFKDVRAMGSDKPWIHAEYNVAGTKVRAAVVNGLGNTRKLIRAIRKGEVEYDFVEVMACPGGCVGGGGQPIHFNQELATDRAKAIYTIDKNNKLRFSHENPDIIDLYNDYLGQPCGELAHHLLHTDQHGWDLPHSPHLDADVVE